MWWTLWPEIEYGQIWTAHSMPVARGCVSTHANNCKKNLAREKFCFDSFSFLLTENENEQRHSVPAFARLFSGSWEKRFPARKVFFSRPLFQAQRKWLKRSCSHACGREEGPKEPRIGPRTGCETCQAGWRMVACLDPSGDIGSRAPASKHNPGSPERIRRHYYLEARGLSLSGQRVGLQARRVWARILGWCINFKLACCLAQPRGLPFSYNTQAVASRFLNSCWDDTDDRHLPAREVLAGRFPPSSVSTPPKKNSEPGKFLSVLGYQNVLCMLK